MEWDKNGRKRKVELKWNMQVPLQKQEVFLLLLGPQGHGPVFLLHLTIPATTGVEIQKYGRVSMAVLSFR
jgi:hypothetical protein